MQVVGHLVTQDRTRGGIVASVGSAQVAQPDRVTIDAATGEEVGRSPQAPLSVQTVHVRWEDGTESDLAEVVDSWEVLGSVAIYPRPDDDPVAATEGYDAHKARVAEALADVGGYFAQVRAAAPFYEEAVAAAQHVQVVDDPTFRYVLTGDRIGAGSEPSATFTPAPPAL